MMGMESNLESIGGIRTRGLRLTDLMDNHYTNRKRADTRLVFYPGLIFREYFRLVFGVLGASDTLHDGPPAGFEGGEL